MRTFVFTPIYDIHARKTFRYGFTAHSSNEGSTAAGW